MQGLTARCDCGGWFSPMVFNCGATAELLSPTKRGVPVVYKADKDKTPGAWHLLGRCILFVAASGLTLLIPRSVPPAIRHHHDVLYSWT